MHTHHIGRCGPSCVQDDYPDETAPHDTQRGGRREWERVKAIAYGDLMGEKTGELGLDDLPGITVREVRPNDRRIVLHNVAPPEAALAAWRECLAEGNVACPAPEHRNGWIEEP